MKNELLEALNILEQEKNISKDTLIEAIENSLVTACKNHFGKSDNIRVDMDPETCEYHVYQSKTVVEEVTDPVMEVSLAKAKGGAQGIIQRVLQQREGYRDRYRTALYRKKCQHQFRKGRCDPDRERTGQR